MAVRVELAVPVQIWHKQSTPSPRPRPPSRLRREKRGEGDDDDVLLLDIFGLLGHHGAAFYGVAAPTAPLPVHQFVATPPASGSTARTIGCTCSPMGR